MKDYLITYAVTNDDYFGNTTQTIGSVVANNCESKKHAIEHFEDCVTKINKSPDTTVNILSITKLDD